MEIDSLTLSQTYTNTKNTTWNDRWRRYRKDIIIILNEYWIPYHRFHKKITSKHSIHIFFPSGVFRENIGLYFKEKQGLNTLTKLGNCHAIVMKKIISACSVFIVIWIFFKTHNGLVTINIYIYTFTSVYITGSFLVLWFVLS